MIEIAFHLPTFLMTLGGLLALLMAGAFISIP